MATTAVKKVRKNDGMIEAERLKPNDRLIVNGLQAYVRAARPVRVGHCKGYVEVEMVTFDLDGTHADIVIVPREHKYAWDSTAKH